MARLLIIGASQGIGLETVKAALAAGHTVRAFARRASTIAIEDAYLEKVDSDARDGAALAKALNGEDGVVLSLGVALTPETILRGTRLFGEATRALVDAMTTAGPRRLVVVTGLGAGDSRGALGPLYGAAFQLSLRRIYDDKDIQEMVVRRSALDWTILRPGILTSDQQTTCRAIFEPKDWRPGPVSRMAVAAYIVAHLDDAATHRQTPLLLA